MTSKSFEASIDPVLALVVCSILPEEPQLSSAEKNKAQNEVISFVNNQIVSLPSYLKVPFKFILFVFNSFALILFGNIFININREKQTKYLNIWANSSIKPMRDFIKLIRSCALLQYYDSQHVLPKMMDYKIKAYDKQLQP